MLSRDMNKIEENYVFDWYLFCYVRCGLRPWLLVDLGSTKNDSII